MANRCNDVEHAQWLDLRSDVRRYFEEQGVLPHDKLRVNNLETISKWSEEWQTLQRAVLDPSEILEVSNQLKWKNIIQRKKDGPDVIDSDINLKIWMLEVYWMKYRQYGGSYYNIIMKPSNNIGSYCLPQKPWIIASPEFPAFQIEGRLCFVEMWYDRNPRGVSFEKWRQQIKLQLYISARHLEESSTYKGYSLLAVVIKPGSFITKDEWIHWRDIVDQDEDWIEGSINKASALFTNSSLPRLMISPGKREVAHLENINLNLKLDNKIFEPEQNISAPIAVGTRVYHLPNRRFGEVASLCKTYDECKVKWEDRLGNVRKEASRQSTAISCLYPTPVKRQRQPTLPNETVVICGGSRKEFVGCLGVILTIRAKQARVRLQSGVEANFQLYLLHSLTTAKDNPKKYGGQDVCRSWRIPAPKLEDFYYGALENIGHGFSLVKYKHQTYNTSLEAAHECTVYDAVIQPNEGSADSAEVDFDLQMDGDWISLMDAVEQECDQSEKDKIRYALSHLDSTALDSTMACHCTQRINQRDLKTLEQDVCGKRRFHEWYYDDWIDMFSRCLELAYSLSETMCKIFSWADYCTITRRQNDVDGLLRVSAQWKKTLCSSEVRYLMFPIIESSHWSLVLICYRSGHRSFAIHLDSMNHGKTPSLTRFAWDAMKVTLGYFHEEFQDLDLTECVDTPQQENANDCGPYILLFMHKIMVAAHAGNLQHKEQILEDISSWEVTASDIQKFRIFMYHLAKKGLDN